MGKPKQKAWEEAGTDDLLRKVRNATAKSDFKEVANLQNLLGNQFRLAGDYENALHYHQEEIKTTKRHNANDKMGLGIAYRNMGEVYIDMKEHKQAIKYVNLYLKIAKDVGNRVEEQRACITLGRAYMYMGTETESDDSSNAENHLDPGDCLKTGETWFRQAYELLTDEILKSQIKDEKERMIMKCNNCHNLGIVLELRGKDADAISWLTKAVDIGNKYLFHESLAPCYSLLCSVYLKTRKSKEALNAARNAAKTAKNLGDLSLEIEANILEAKALFLKDEVDAGKKILKRLREKVRKKDTLHNYLDDIDPLLTAAVRISRKEDSLIDITSDEEKMKLFETLGDNYTTLCNYLTAITHYKKSCECAEKLNVQGKKLSRLYFSIAETYKDLEMYADALKYYMKEMEVNRGNAAEEFKTQTNITLLLEKMNKSVEDVIQAHEHAIKLAKDTRNLSKEVTARSNFAIYLKGVGRGNEAENQTDVVSKIRNDNFICEDEEIDSQDQDVPEEDEIDLDDLSEEDESDEDDDDRRVARRRAITIRRNEAGETQLHVAAKKGDLKTLRKLIRQGHSVNTRDNAGWTPLHEACNWGFLAVVQDLLKHGADVNDAGGALAMAEKITPLHDAASNGHCEIMKVLLEHGANALARDKDRRYPIDALVNWFESAGESCGESDLVMYREVKEMLKVIMEKGGRPYRKEDEAKARKKVRRENQSPQRSYLVEKTRDYDCPIPVKIVTDFDPDEEGDGRKIYQNTMKQMRRKESDANRARPRRAMSPGPRGALIPAEKDVNEDWMVPDGSVATTSASRSFKPKRKRSSLDDYVNEDDSGRRNSGGNKQRRRRRSEASTSAKSDSYEEMDMEFEENSRDGTVISNSSRTSRTLQSPAFEDDDLIDLCADELDYDISNLEHDNFLPSQRPVSPTIAFGRTIDVEGVFHNDGLTLDGRRNRSKRTPTKKSRNITISSDSDDDDILSKRGNKHTFSNIASAFKQTASTSGRSDTNRSKKTLKQSRLPVTIISQPKRSSNFDDVLVVSDDDSAHSSSDILRRNRKSNSSIVDQSNGSQRRKKEIWRFKVWINGKPLLVPVEEDHFSKPIDWLAAECATRFHQTNGVKPILTLQTKDGAILSGTDPINLVLDDGRELEGVVGSFDLPPLVERYTLACVGTGSVNVNFIVREPDEDIKSKLNVCQSSNVLNLTDVNLRGTATPLMTALLRQSSLSSLILSGCSLFDKGIAELSNILSTLSGLTHLDLSSNGITKSGFVKFADVFSEVNLKEADALSIGCQPPLGLGTLILSHNPLGSYIGTHLAALLNRLAALKRLELSDCDFTEKLFTWSRNDLTKAFTNSRLEELDISYNNLKDVGIEKCLMSLPARRIRSLNCSSCATSLGSGNLGGNDAVANAVCSFLSRNEDCWNLSTLKLNDCGLTDKSMDFLLETFDRLVRLENLEVACNNNITPSSLINILNRSVEREVPIKKLDMGSIPGFWRNTNASDEMILNALEVKMSSNKRLIFLKLPTEEIQVIIEEPQLLSKLESRLIALMEDYTGNTRFSYKKFGGCIVYQFDD